MIPFKDILLEAMRPNVATTIFAKYGVRNAAHLDKGQLRKYYMALVKKHHSDVGGDDADMKWINAAYDVLKKTAKDEPEIELKPEDKIVNVEFRNKTDQEILESGQCNYSEFTEMMAKIHDEGTTAEVKPPINYDTVHEKWLVSSVEIYMDADDFYMVSPYIEPFFKH